MVQLYSCMPCDDNVTTVLEPASSTRGHRPKTVPWYIQYTLNRAPKAWPIRHQIANMTCPVMARAAGAAAPAPQPTSHMPTHKWYCMWLCGPHAEIEKALL